MGPRNEAALISPTNETTHVEFLTLRLVRLWRKWVDNFRAPSRGKDDNRIDRVREQATVARGL